MGDSKHDALVDAAEAPRESEKLDLARLTEWMAAHVDGFAPPIGLRQFRKGHSNLTYLVARDDGSGSEPGDEWVLRRGPFGSNVATAHDMGREYRILSGLHRAYPPAPRAFALCEDNDVIGAPFYVMQRVRGTILRAKPPAELGWTPALGERMCSEFVDHLVRIHGVDLERAGLVDFGHPEGYVRRQVEGWTARYDKSRTDDVPEVDAVARWLAEKMPAEADGRLIHNDFKYDNVVLDTDALERHDPRIIGVLDWEMATVGDPLMDLGTTLSYWVTAEDTGELAMLPFGVARYPGSWSRERLVAEYGERSGRDVAGVDFYHVFGLFKTAVVAQQIYYRFKTGKTDDPRFQMMILGVKVLSKFASGIAERSHL